MDFGVITYHIMKIKESKKRRVLRPCQSTKKTVEQKKNTENLLCTGFYHPNGPQSENQRQRKEIQLLKTLQRTKKAVEH